MQNTHKFVLGASAQAGINIAGPLQFVVNAGVLNFFGKTVYYNELQDAPSYSLTTSMQVLPIKAGLRYFLEPNFYLQGNAGISLLLNNSDFGFKKSSAFTYSPQIGVLLPVGDKNFIDIGLRYEATGKYDADTPQSKYELLALKVAFGF